MKYNSIKYLKPSSFCKREMSMAGESKYFTSRRGVGNGEPFSSWTALELLTPHLLGSDRTLGSTTHFEYFHL